MENTELAETKRKVSTLAFNTYSYEITEDVH